MYEVVSKPRIASQYKASGAASAMCNIGENAASISVCEYLEEARNALIER